ncbi:hypothetical protein B1757_02570 [Acidithiobacillus marinus]|uniref:Uncharacterized protein n=1 Tax=Acidithiobacillus marinus TaxID=187490 RepID=A0A2I1DPT3_9PROT|nr:hypothetical protein B1757_02570 [Acidithiobacillus marinus]
MIIQLLRYRQCIDAVRDKSVETPRSFMWMTLALTLQAIPVGYFSSFAPEAAHLPVLYMVVATWLLLMHILYLKFVEEV